MMLFLSHAGGDRPLSEKIKAHLARLGVDTYLAEHDNQAGRTLSNKLREALRRCELVVVLLTRTGFDSEYVQQEIGAAVHAGKLVIPLVDSSIEHPQSRLAMLNGTEWIELDPATPTEAITQLSERVAKLAARQANRELAITAALIVIAVAALYVATRSNVAPA